MLRRTPMAQEREQLPIVTQERGNRPSTGVSHGDTGGVIVEPAKIVLGVTFEIRRVGRGPIGAIADIPEQMKRCPSQRIASACDRTGSPSVFDTGVPVCLACSTGNRQIARRERQPAAVVDSASRNGGKDIG